MGQREVVTNEKSMPKKSAGLLLYRNAGDGVEVFLVHPGGPFWAKKDEGAWSIPKGEFVEDEDAMAAAKREFHEETGLSIDGKLEELKPVKQPSGKIVYAWAVEGDVDASAVRSNKFSMEWPPGSGKVREFPEVDRGGWFDFVLARKKILKGQMPLLEQLQERLQSRKSANTIDMKASKRASRVSANPKQGRLFEKNE
jgi:predicted NUDIX family NTP pyrophosphohydrolase